MCLADYAHDDGRDWHSIAAIMEWTCLGKTAVISALHELQRAGLLTVDRGVGRNNINVLRVKRIQEMQPPDRASKSTNQSSWRTSTQIELVRQENQSAWRTSPSGDSTRAC